jgi:hypothetical protein
MAVEAFVESELTGREALDQRDPATWRIALLPAEAVGGTVRQAQAALDAEVRQPAELRR